MKGLIEAAQSEGQTEEQGAVEGAAMAGQKYKSKVIDAIPEEFRDAFERVVLAGMKVLYSKDMQPEIQQQLAEPGPMWKKLGEGIAKLMTILDQQAGKGLPQQIVIPAAIELVHEYTDFLNRTGKVKVSPDELREATMYVVVTTAKLYGATDDQIKQMFAGGDGVVEAEPPAGEVATEATPDAMAQEV